MATNARRYGPPGPSINANQHATFSTLGPAGTCSEGAVHHLSAARRQEASVLLRPSYEEAVSDVRTGTADAAVVAAAYPELNGLVFGSAHHLEIAGAFLCPTPAFGLAGVPGKAIPSSGKIRVATHPAPQPILRRYALEHPPLSLVAVAAQSNADAAIQARRGTVDFALTQLDSARAYGLDFLWTFGPVTMAWVLFQRKKGQKGSQT